MPNPVSAYLSLSVKLRAMVCASLVLASITTAFSAEPRVPAWSISEFLAWEPDGDPDDVFNRGTIPLANRVEVSAELQANSNAKLGQGRIESLDTYNASTSGNPPQGRTGEGRYTFTYWQYVNQATYWGGSAGEGIFLTPSGEMIDSAHRNGVPIYGDVFFPPNVFGGQFTWVEQFLVQAEDGSFPGADQLIKIANYFGFDGWFLNQETMGGDVLDAAAMRDLILYVRANSDIRIAWYDSMIEAGTITWQDQFNGLNDWYLRFPETVTGELGAHHLLGSRCQRTHRTEFACACHRAWPGSVRCSCRF